MTVFGVVVTNKIREDAVFVLAVSLLLIGLGTFVRQALDTSGANLRIQQLELRVYELEQIANDKRNRDV